MSTMEAEIEEEETLTVEKMISLTFKTVDRNVVDFKMLQIILLILAHRMDILQREVEIKERKKGEGQMQLDHSSSSSIELVTWSQFKLLETKVKNLMKQTKPVPVPSMPDNKQIREALSKGTITLSGSMEAVQLNARLEAAEQALAQMFDLLNKLTDLGALSPEMINQLDKDQELKALMPAEDAGKLTTDTEPQTTLVTRPVLSEATDNLKNKIMDNITNMTYYSTKEAVNAAKLVDSFENQMVIAFALRGHINNLELLIAKNAEQLSGVKVELHAQMQNFEEQVRQLQDSLNLMTTEYDLENPAVTELQSNQERMKLQVDQTLYHLTSLFATIRHHNNETFDLLKWMKVVFEEKIDKEELMNGLKQKLDMDRLEGLLRNDVFEESRKDLYKQLETCVETFEENNTEWVTVLKNLLKMLSKKLTLSDLNFMAELVTGTLKEIKETLCRLDLMMGDAKLALLARQLARNAYCGSCMIPAIMEPFDKTSGMPPELPKFLLDHYLKAEEEPILKLRPPDKRKQICKRWVGGSHTIITEHKTQEKMPLSELQKRPIRYFAATAGDGRIYMMEEELEPCIQCNLVSTDIDTKQHPSSSDVGAGDQSPSNEAEYIPELASIMSNAGSSRFKLN